MIPENEWTKSQREVVGTQFVTDKGSVLTVTGVSHKDRSRVTVFILECDTCSKDTELWSYGSIVSYKSDLVRGRVPCGCAKRPKWSSEQDLTLTNRLLAEKIPHLKTVGTIEKKGKARKFILECEVCSKDEELWPYGSITSSKIHLVNGGVPCGCSKIPQWTKPQFETLINRKCLERRYEFQGFVGEWKGARTYLRLHNPKNDNTWESATINSFFSRDRGCPLEGRSNTIDKQRTPQTVREQKINKVLAVDGGTFVGWEGEYKGKNSKFKWICSEGHPCETTVTGFLNNSNRCMTCRKIKQREEGYMHGYYPARKEEKDNLYIIHFMKGDYIKVGRSFDVEKRLKGLLKLSDHERNEVEILSIYTGNHKEVYDTEQWIHEELTERGFYHEDSEWTVETFDTDCKDVLFRLLSESALSECTD